MERVILHISDLHCKTSNIIGDPRKKLMEEWESRFSALCSHIKIIRPNIITITGDLVDFPVERNYMSLVEAVQEMANVLDNNVFVVVVPGNHDYYLFGLRFLKKLNIGREWWRRAGLYSAYEKFILFPSGTMNDLLTVIYEKFGIAIYPADSNYAGDNIHEYIGVSEGNVKDPRRFFEEYCDFYDKLSAPDDIARINIALLHHHPLPVPVNGKFRRGTEHYRVLRNAWEFLRAAEESEVDIILHGHEHVDNVSQYRSKTEQDYLSVFSCASSCDKNIGATNVIKISDHGAFSFKKYRSNKFGSLKYEICREHNGNEGEYQGDIRTYGAQRKRKMYDFDMSVVESVKTKTKTIVVLSNGTANIAINYAGIKWSDGVDRDAVKICENIHSDVGRVFGGVKNIYNERGRRGRDLEWYNEALKNFKKQEFRMPVDPENVCIEIFANENNDLDLKQLAHCEILYFFYNGFRLSCEDFDEMYGLKYENYQSKEYSCIYSDYKVDTLELIVRFPSENIMPDSKELRVVAIKSDVWQLKYEDIIKT